MTWSENALDNTGYLFEIAIVKPKKEPIKHIRAKIVQKRRQIELREYCVEVQKNQDTRLILFLQESIHTYIHEAMLHYI